jgi:hypothetical protein
MFKKFMVGAIISAMSVSAFASQNIYLTFKDGRSVVYKNVPDNIDNAQFANMLMRDYGKDFNTDLDLTKSRIEENTPSEVNNETETGFWDSTTGKVIKWTAIIVLGYYVIKALPVGGKSCFTGPRGGTYTLTKSGAKNYAGC